MRKLLQSDRLHVWQPCRKKLPQKSEIFPAGKKWERNSFLRRFLPQNVSLGTLKAKMTLMLRSYVKDYKNLSQTSCVPPKALLEALNAFWQNAIIKFTEVWKVFRWRSKKSSIKVFNEAFFPQINFVDTRNSVFKTMQNFLPKFRKSLDKLENRKKLLQNLPSLEKPLLKAYLTFWTASSRSCSPKTKKHYTQSRITYKKSSYWSNFHLVKKCNFENLVKKTTKSFIFFRSRPENIQSFLVLLPNNRKLL